MKKQIIVVAGGSGSRMESKLPKQFIELNKKAILLHTLERLMEVVPVENIILVLPLEEYKRWEKLSKNTPFEALQLAPGGETRFHSVKSGLSMVDPNALVGVHDSVRPFVSVKTIQACFAMAQKKGSGIPTIPLNDSIRRIFEGTSRTENREKYRLVQTPQCFQANQLIQAYNRRFAKRFTDDAAVYEASGKKVFLVDGNPENIKLTRPVDLRLAELMIER